MTEKEKCLTCPDVWIEFHRQKIYKMGEFTFFKNDEYPKIIPSGKIRQSRIKMQMIWEYLM